MASLDTLQATDQIDGGAGADTFNMSVSKDFSGFTVGTGFLKNVETVNVTNGALSTAYSFSGRGVTGVETYNVSGPVNLSGLSSTTPVVNFSNLAGTAAANRNMSVGFDQEAVAGTADKFTIGLNAVGTAPLTSTGQPQGWVALTTTGVENLTLAVTGTSYASLATGTGAVKNLTV
ncbi:MAG: hypothetical protein EB101_08440, partial [Chitinophagia bacterium]|nr:hypothetical protein [Chitinophagia bacterium]